MKEPPMSSLEEAVRRLEDRQTITDLNHHLCQLIDSFQLQRMVDEVFAPDGSDDHGGGPVVGRDAIRAWYEDSTANVETVAHNLCNVVVEFHDDGDRATMRSNVITHTWTMANAGGDRNRPCDYSLSLAYVDKLTRYREGWRIDSRTLVAHPSKSGDSHVVAAGELPGTQRGIQALSRRPAPTSS
jgi:SnoaL-like domain